MRLKDNYKLNLAVLTFAGILLRFLWILNIESSPVSDFWAYQNLAEYMFRNEFNNFLGFQGPGYPLALGWFYKLIGSTNIFGAKLLNFILSSLTLIIIMRILTILFNNRKAVYAAYAAVVFLPNYIAYNSIVATETLYLFLFSLMVLLQVSEKSKILRHVMLGAVIGLGSLVKPYMMAYPVIAALIYWLKNKNSSKTLQFFIAVQLACICVIAPWTYRNYRIYKEFIPISFNGGYVMYINNNDQNKGSWMPLTDVKMTYETLEAIKASGYTYEKAVTIFSTKLDKVFKQEAVKWIKSNPKKFMNLALRRVAYTFFKGPDDVYAWSMNGENSNNLVYRLASSEEFKKLSTNIIKILSFCGLVFTLRYAVTAIRVFFSRAGTIGYEISIPLFNIAFSVMLSIVYEGQPRYNFNVLFLFAVCICVLIFKSTSAGKVSDSCGIYQD
jgi:hypothetical protein